MTGVNQSRTILLVDDEADIRDVLQLALIDAGYDVLLAHDGKEALDLFRRRRPPIVITDIKMPGMNGIDLLKKIKRDAPDTEVLMITGHGDMDLAVLSLKHQASDFITKPINVDALEIALKRAEARIKTRKTLEDYTTNLERLLKEKSELQDHLATLGMMISCISHGIKGLLTGLDGGVYLLESGLKREDTAKVNQGMETVRVVTSRIRHLVMDILFYAKKRELRREPVDVDAFVREVVQAVAPKIADLSINFNHRIDAGLGHCPMDPGYIHAALMTLFDNAMDACGRHKAGGPHDICFEVRRTEGGIKFCVADTGIGMDEETLSQLFTVFFSSKGRKGTGLGLFIANQNVVQHGGRIEVSSAPRRGSRFMVFLPCLPENQTDHPPIK